MICSSKKILMTALIPAAIAAGIMAGRLLKLIVEMHSGIDMARISQYPIISSGYAVMFMVYIILFGVVTMVMMSVYRIKVKAYMSRQDIAKEKTGVQRESMKDAVDQLQYAYTEIEKQEHAKSRFLSRMSHDMRTPMNAIMGYSMLLENVADQKDKVIHYAQKIFMSGQALMELINDALDMNCIENGNIKLIENEFSLLSALEEIKTSVTPQMDAKGQNFRYYLTNSTETDVIRGDKQRLCQSLRNILSNATKYTPEGGNIDMIVNIIGAGRGRVKMMCQIKDTGCGMSPEFLEMLFVPFAREETEINTSIPGTGLGMCIARSFIELMKGELSVESKQGEGTLVTVIVPLDLAETADPKKMHDFSGRIIKGMNFLVAEDNESNAEIICEVLHAMDAECTITENGQAAVEAFKKSKPGEYDIILMDIQMPVMNGYQAAAAIRRSDHPDAKDIHIVAMTADAFEEDVQKAFASGMNAHVAKPLDLQAFINTISSLKIAG